MLLYFHANGEDLGICYEMLINLQQALKINVVAMEYPGYGVYKGSPSEKQVLSDAEQVMRYLTMTMMFSPKDVFVMGRSIGTGPASQIASTYPSLGGVFLVSPFSSIKAVAESLLGDQLPMLLRNQFENIRCAKKTRCPYFVIHGKEDSLIPVEQSEVLLSYCASRTTGYKFPPAMTHNRFNLLADIINPIRTFCKINGIRLGVLGPVVTLPSNVYNQRLAGDTPLEVILPSCQSLTAYTDTTSHKKYSECVMLPDKLNETCS